MVMWLIMFMQPKCHSSVPLFKLQNHINLKAKGFDVLKISSFHGTQEMIGILFMIDSLKNTPSITFFLSTPYIKINAVCHDDM